MKKFYCSSHLIGKSIITKPFREHNDVVIALLNVMESFLLQKNFGFDDCNNKDICVCISRRCRVFIVYEQSIHCFSFPFTISNDSGEYILNYIDEQISTREIYILRSLFVKMSISTSIESFFDEFLSVMESFSIKTQKDIDFCYRLFFHLLNYETGYIRFDHDLDRAVPKVHPENHFDIFFSQKSSFKVGLNKIISINDMIDILDPDSFCYFIDERLNG